MNPLHLKLDDIEQQTRSLRNLVMAVVHDGHLAEDVLQDTWLVALGQGEAPENPRSWLAGVARNLALRMNRSQGRRRRHEGAAAQTDISSAELWPERSASLHALIRELERLPEPFRETLTLRYLDGVPPREIAQRQDASLATIKSRLHRGLKKLRERLDARNPSWTMAVLGLARGGGVSQAGGPAPDSLAGIGSVTNGIALGTFIGATTMKLASLILVPIIIAGVWWIASTPGGEGSHEDLDSAGPSAAGIERPSPEPSDSSDTDDSPLAGIPFAEESPSPPETRNKTAASGATGSVAVRRQGQSAPLTSVSAGELEVEATMRDPGGLEKHTLRLPIEDGNYRWPLGAEEIRIIGATADGNRFQPDNVTRTPHSPDIKGTLLFPVVLRVISADSGQELSGVELALQPRWKLAAATPSIAHTKVSPIEIPAPKAQSWNFTHSYWIRAPHHAWTQIDIDHSQSGDRTVALPLTSKLSLNLMGGEGRDLLLRVDFPTKDGVGVTRLATHIGKQRRSDFESFPSGSWTLRIEDNGPMTEVLNRDERLVWKRDIVLTPGETLVLTAEIPDVQPNLHPAVLIAGTLEVPACWPHETVNLSISGPQASQDGRTHRVSWRLSDLEQMGPTSFSFSTEDFAAGRLFFNVDPMRFTEGIDVPQGGNSGLRIVVAPPSVVTVTLKDAATAKALKQGELNYMLEPKGKSPSHMEFTRAKGNGPEFKIKVMQGTLELMADAKGYKTKSHTVELGPAPQAIVLSLVPPTGISFKVKENGQVLPYSQKWRIKLTGLDSGRACGWSMNGIEVTEPGRYRFTMEAPSGFQAIEPRHVDIREGEVVPVEVNLIRK